MSFALTEPLLARISGHFKIRSLIQSPRLVPGGKVHQVWKLQTAENTYALKRILTARNALSLYREAERIAARFKAQGLPAWVCAMC